MAVEIARMSSKGQVVIPMHLRKRLKAREGTIFAVVGTSDSLMLKKMTIPSKGELLESVRTMAKESGAILKKGGMTERDVIRKAVRARGR